MHTTGIGRRHHRFDAGMIHVMVSYLGHRRGVATAHAGRTHHAYALGIRGLGKGAEESVGADQLAAQAIAYANGDRW